MGEEERAALTADLEIQPRSMRSALVVRLRVLGVLVACAFAWVPGTFAGLPPFPDKGTLAADLRKLDRLIDDFGKTDGSFGLDYAEISLRLADEVGVRILHAVMVKCRAYTGEEPLVFVQLVTFLDRKPTLSLLRRYEKSRLEMERIYAHEFLTEIKMADPKAVAEFLRKARHKK